MEIILFKIQGPMEWQEGGTIRIQTSSRSNKCGVRLQQFREYLLTGHQRGRKYIVWLLFETTIFDLSYTHLYKTWYDFLKFCLRTYLWSGNYCKFKLHIFL